MENPCNVLYVTLTAATASNNRWPQPTRASVFAMAFTPAVPRFLVPVLVLAAAAAGAGYWVVTGIGLESTDDAYVRADISNITPRVGAEVMAVHVTDNQRVRAGDVLIELDPRDYAARLANAQAAVMSAEAAVAANVEQVKLRKSLIGAVRASVSADQASLAYLQKEWDRAEHLLALGVVTAQRLETAQVAFHSGEAGVARSAAGAQAAQQQVAATEAEGRQARAQLEQQKAMLEVAKLDLAATVIRAPVDGAVGNLAARLGERVSPGERLLSLVPLDAVYVVANFKETQLTRMMAGQPVSLAVDAFPDHKLRGRVDSLAPASGGEFSLLPAQNASGNFTKIVQRVPVKIALTLEPELVGRLVPGMSVVATVDVQTKPAASPAVAAK